MTEKESGSIYVGQPLVLVAQQDPLLKAPSEALLLVGFEDGESTDSLRAVDELLGGWLTESRSRGEFRGDAAQVVVVPTFLALDPTPAVRIALVGLGKRRDLDLRTFRNAVTAALRTLGKRGIRTAAVDVAGLPLAAADAGEAAAEAAELSLFRVDIHRSGAHRDEAIHELRICGASTDVVKRGSALGRAKNFARDLVNEPGNILDAVELARRASAMAERTGLSCQVFGAEELAELEMGAFLAVARGTARPPRLIILRHEPRSMPRDGAPVLVLVGKAVTFDTGGISLKPSAEMGRMKGDMAGGAAVVGAMQAIAELNVPARVIGLVPAVNNMPDADAWMPGDVIRAMSGKTIETISTDAEGRMLLADTVHYAGVLGGTHVVDIATLTGACVTALGHTASALFGTDGELVRLIQECGDASGERHWPMPLFSDYRELIRSDIADLKNSGGRAAGSITGAWFIREFAGDIPWAHLDIAGSSQFEKARPWAPAGPTGTGVGTFVRLAERLSVRHR